MTAELEKNKVEIHGKLSRLLSGNSSAFWAEIVEWLDSFCDKHQKALLNTVKIEEIIKHQESIKLATALKDLPQRMRESLELAMKQIDEQGKSGNTSLDQLNFIARPQSGVKQGGIDG